MTSKNLFFKLQKEDLKRRIWTIALSVLAFFLFLTVALAISIGNYDTTYLTKEQIARYLEGVIGSQYLLVSFITVAGAVICGLSSFFYLHSRKKVDLYHSIPVRRELLFAVNFLNGVLIYLVPYIVNVILCFVILQINGYMSTAMFATAFTAVGINLLFYCLIYTLAIIAVMLTGNFIVSCFGTAVFLLYGPVLMGVKIMYCLDFYKTYGGDRSDSVIFKFLSPLGSYYTIINPRELNELQADPASILKTILVTAVLILFSLFLYKKRPSEAAGKAMAFSVSKPVIKFLLVIPAALAGGIIFRQIASNASTGWFIFGLVFIFIISCGIIEIIYDFDIRSIFNHKKHMLICGAVVAVIVGIFQFDLFKYDLYIPDKNKIESMSIAVSGLDDNLDYLEQDSQGNGFRYTDRDTYQLKYMELTDIRAAYTLAGQGIENVKDDGETDSQDYFTYRIKYNLKNGRTVYRNYSLPLEESNGLLKELFASEEFKKGHYPIFNWDAGDITAISSYNRMENKDFGLDEGEKQELLDIYKAELMKLSVDEITAVQPAATVVFWLKEDNTKELRSGRSVDYYVYPQFENTISFLKEHGFDPSKQAGVQDVRSIRINNYQSLTDKSQVYQTEYAVAQTEYAVAAEEVNRTVTYTDKNKIEVILPYLIDSDYCWNFRSILNWEKDMEVRLDLSKDEYGNEESYNYYFREDVPGFVKQAVNYREEE